MIHGYVDANLEPMIQLAVQAETGEACEIDALLDTGFNGFLTLPSALVASLGYPWVCDEEATLADGSTQQLTVHAGKVIWDGQLREIEVACANALPLLGMSMLRGGQLQMQVCEGGAVAIEVGS